MECGVVIGLDRKSDWSYNWSSALTCTTFVTVLPPYDPSLADFLPATHAMSGDELMRRYSISKSQFHNRKAAIPTVRGVVRGRSKVFVPSEIHQLDACHWYLNNGYTLKEVEEAQRIFSSVATEEELYRAQQQQEEEEEQRVAEANLATLRANLRQVPPGTVAQFTNTMERVAVTLETITTGQKLLKDPLRTLRALQEASDEAWEISSKILASMLEMAPVTVQGWSGDQYRNGFHIKKIGPGKWRVFREDEGKHSRRAKGEENS